MRTFLLSSFLFLFFIKTSFAKNKVQTESDSLTTYWLSEIVVTAKKRNDIQITPIKEITARAIKKLNIVDMSQALSLVPSLYITTSAKNEKTFRLRGIDQRQISVFLDGIPISIPFNGIIDLSQFTGDHIAKIRVTEGISSVLYGTNNIGGSVNIITEEPPVTPKLKFRLENNPFGKFFSSVSFGSSVGKLMYLAAFNFDKASDFVLPQKCPPMPNEDGGRRNNSAYQKMNGFAKLRYVLNNSHQIGLYFNWINNSFNVAPNALSKRPRFWQFPVWDRYLLGFNTYHSFKFLFLRSTWYFDRYKNILKSYDDATYSTQTKRYAFTSTYDDYSIGVNIFPEMHLLSLGKTSGIISFKKDVHREKSEHNPFNEYAMQTLSMGLEQNIRLSSPLIVQVAGDANYLKPFKAQNYPVRDAIFLFNAQMSLKYFLGKHWNLHFASGRKSRFPTLKELYSEYLGRSIANPNLKPEHGFNNEVGLEYRETKLSVQWNLFYNQLHDLIVPVVISKKLNQMQNIGKSVFSGTEVSLRYKSKLFHWLCHYTFLKALNRSSNRTSSHLEYRPNHLFFLSLNYQPGQHWNLQSELQGAAGQYYQNQDNLKWQKLNDYILMNFRLQYQWNLWLQIYMRVNNVFDRFYFSEWGVPMPGRQIVFGLQTEL